MTTIGIIGAGHIGSQIARAATRHGYDVVISNSRGPETLAGVVEGAQPMTDNGYKVDLVTTLVRRTVATLA